jgi:ABC-type nickel/cobalt efflux system permease component RcnA
MYINIGKILRRLSIVVGILVLVLGVIIFALSKTATEQSSGTLLALFGLMLLWFTIWLQRTAPSNTTATSTSARNSSNASTSITTKQHQEPPRAHDNLRRRA